MRSTLASAFSRTGQLVPERMVNRTGVGQLHCWRRMNERWRTDFLPTVGCRSVQSSCLGDFTNLR